MKLFLTATGIILLLATLAGLLWLGVSTEQRVGVLLAFAAGLSMIFLPCTLPLVFVILPLALSKNPTKGFAMALLFGLGIALTLAIYGALISQIGEYLGLDRFTQYMFLLAGTMAILFGWSELRFLNISLPEVKSSFPKWLQEKNEYLKALGMGLLLGNAGIGCPNPAFYVILTYIATLGSPLVGAGLGFAHGIGRAFPLLFITLLALAGFNATKWIVSSKAKIDKIMGWGLVVVGAFILTYGLWGMDWWEESIFHRVWNQILFNLSPYLAESPDHPVAKGAFKGPIWIGWLTWIVVILLSVVWYWAKFKKKYEEK